MQLKSIGIIPARYGSSRFPGKPLAKIHGIPMIERVYRQCILSKKLDQVMVATDNDEIFNHLKSIDAPVVMTSEQLPSGTDRCKEALINSALDIAPDAVIINIQGDEPYIDPKQIDQLVDLVSNEKVNIGTLIRPLEDENLINSPNSVKVVVNKHNKALYFSRQPIPFQKKSLKSSKSHYFQHIGIYGYRWNCLKEICNIAPSFLEQTESLEQLRWLENGYDIYTAISTIENHAVDVPEDIKKIEKWYSNI